MRAAWMAIVSAVVAGCGGGGDVTSVASTGTGAGTGTTDGDGRRHALATDSFLTFVQDQLSTLTEVEARPMFGGHGLYLGDRFFGIVWKGRCFLRTDAATRPRYVAAGSEPFRPNSRQTLAAYYEVPAAVLEDHEALVAWARDAAGGAR